MSLSDRAAAEQSVGREAAVAERRTDSLAASAELARRIAAIVDDKKGGEIIALDVRELVGYTDYLLIATARNERQAKAIHDEVHLRLKKDDGLLPARIEGEAEGRWVLVDYLACVLHLMVPEIRDRYRLEKLWGEAERLELGVDGEAPAQ
ncbi:MAG: iojap-like protein [Solirubrobacterales bacterium]|jgi:ribosome-associated protein|nr:iojap-like protein [Solirubrobacterales bacterium]